MKLSLLFAFSICMSLFVTAQNVNIPDANFKAYLVGNSAINTNSDTEIQVGEAAAFTGNLDCAALGISNLTGIEAFTSITQLNCQINSIAFLNVSNSTALLVLNFSSNLLTSLNISNNTQLNTLVGYDNPLTSLDVSSNLALETLDLGFDNISSIDLSNNMQLTYFSVGYGVLTSLDLSSNTQLFSVSCTNLLLTSLILPNSSTLEFVECQNNQIAALDLSGVTNLVYLTCQNNNLGSLNLENGNNTYITDLITTNNPNLNCIQVDEATYSMNNWIGPDFTFDAGVVFSEDCSAIPNPVITIVSSLSLFAQTLGATSIEQSFTVDGSDLTDNITVTAPTNYEVSLSSGSGFASSVQVNQTSGSVPTTTIYVRLNAGAVGTHNGDITLTSGTLSEAVAVTGNTTQVTIGLNENTLTQLSIFPNPCSGMITLAVNQPTSAVFMSANGAILANLELNGESNIDVSIYAPGVYFIRTAEGQTVKSIKE